MHRDDVPIAEPCSAEWATMTGDARRRFCQMCTKHVHDLSAMTATEAAGVLEQESGPCVRYSTDASGNIRHRGAAAMTVAAVLMAAAPAVADPPSEPAPQTTIRTSTSAPEVVMGEVVVPKPMIMGRVAVTPHEPAPPVDPVRALPTLPEPPAGQTVIPEVQAVIDQQRRRR